MRPIPSLVSSLLAILICFHSSCNARPTTVGTNATPTLSTSADYQSQNAPDPAPKNDSAKTYPLSLGLILKIVGHSATIIDEKGNVLAENRNLIRVADDQGDCPSEGFRNVAVKGDFFTIEQQNCSRNLFVDEYVTFKLVSGKCQLHKMGFSYSDREDPDATLPDDILTQKDFGKLDFQSVDLDSLYRLRKKLKQ